MRYCFISTVAPSTLSSLSNRGFLTAALYIMDQFRDDYMSFMVSCFSGDAPGYLTSVRRLTNNYKLQNRQTYALQV